MSVAEVSGKRCSACGERNAPDARFCNQCAAPLGDAPGAAAALDAERKQVTILFSDLSGYTALSEKLDPEETRELLGGIFARAAEIVGRYDGRIEKFIGDAIMAIFGVPAAHEDDPVRAVRAALELHDAVAALSPEIEQRSGARIALHSGINTGLVVTGELKFDRGTAGPLGDTINLAARLMGLAAAGEILVGPETRRLVGRAFAVEDLGQRDVRGKAEPMPVARVLGAASRAAAPARFRGTFVGRQEELGVLLGAVEQVRDGRPAVVAICGEAGTGKTRLVEEFRARLGDDVQWLEGRAYPYAENIPYFPVIDLLSRSWGIDENDTPAAVREKVEAGVSALVDSPRDVLPVIAPLYDLEIADAPVIDREAFQERLLDTVRLLLSGLVARAPTVICLQDLHWADASTVKMIHALTADLRIPAVLVGNYRPGYDPGPGARVLELRELSSRQTGELLQSILEAEPPEELTRFIEERSDGNPFYVEEVVNSLIETHLLARNGTWTLTGALSEAGVPTTIRGVIAARIDRLDERRRRVLRNAAVVGREFLFSVVAEVIGESAGDADGLQPSLAQLESADLIRVHSRDVDIEYVFKHALTQEVAYDGLLKTERQKLHARAAAAMERILRDRIPEFVETLAYHFLRGGVVDKAVHYLGEAGKKCVARYALAEATSHFREAYALIADRERTPAESRVLAELLVAWSQVHYYDGTVGEWLRLLEKHLDDAERSGDPAMLALYLGWLGNVRTFHGDLLGALESLDRALEVARSVDSRTAVAHALAWRTHTLTYLGRMGEAIRTAESLEQSDEEQRSVPYPHFKNRSGLAIALAFTGDLHRARGVAQELVEFGRASGSARAESLGHLALGMYWALVLDFERSAAVVQMAIEAAKDPHFYSFGAVFGAGALANAQRFEEAARLLDDCLPYLERNENYWLGEPARGNRAGTQLGMGQLSRGMRGLRDQPRSFREKGFELNVFVSEVFLLRTYVSIARRDSSPTLGAICRNLWFVLTQAPFAAARARRLIERLPAEAERKNLRGVLGVIDLSIGRLLAHQGRKAEAREVLQRIRRFLEAAGVEHVPPQVAELAAEIDGESAALPG